MGRFGRGGIVREIGGMGWEFLGLIVLGLEDLFMA